MICDSRGGASNTTASLRDLPWEKVHWADSLTGWPQLFYLHRQHWEMNGRDEGWEGTGLADGVGDGGGRGGSEAGDSAGWGEKNVLAVAQLDHYLRSHKMWCSGEGETDSLEMRGGLLDWYLIISAAAPW